MDIKKFKGADTLEALLRVREELGRDATILSARSVDGGYEILATKGNPFPELVGAPTELLGRQELY